MRAGRFCGILAGTSLCVIAPLARAQVDQGQENTAIFGLVDQNTAGINNGSLACAPTATYNSFVYLNNQFPTSGLGGLLGSGSVSAINELAGDIPGGIPASGGNALAAGKQTYINNHNLGNKVSVESLGNNTTLTPNTAARFIAQQLAAGQDVEMGFLWSNSTGTLSGNGHVVTVTGIDYDETGQNGAMNIVDPWDGVALSGELSVANGELLLGYTGGGAGTGGADGNDPDNPGHAGFGAIAFVTAESLIVPEPTMALGLAMLALLVPRRRINGMPFGSV
jgi:hypothetical protein